MASVDLTVNGAAPLDITCTQGQTFELPVRWEAPVDPEAETLEYGPVDVTGKVLKAQVRAKAAARTALLTFSSEASEDDDAWIEVTDAAGGEFILRATAEAMAAVPAKALVWDLEAKTGTRSEPILAGSFTVVAEVTRG